MLIYWLILSLILNDKHFNNVAGINFLPFI